MNTTRRRLLGLGAVSAAAGLLSGCESLEQRLTKVSLPADALPPPNLPVQSSAMRLLNRVAYGSRPGDVARVSRMGVATYVEEQLAPDALAEEPVLTWQLRALADTLDPDTGLLFDEDDNKLVGTLRQSAILRAVYSRRQLQERMVEFWSDHFNIYAFKGQGPQLKVVDDNQTIRKHSMGKFRDLLGASAQSAAMLGYLDNTANLKGVPNENYARELMELHTLGVHGGYTQHDVKEVARCLTGWTVEKHWYRGRFLFDKDAHDDGVKHVLGVTFAAGGGVEDGNRVLDIVAAHPATAKHLATKLCKHFLGETPKPMVSRLAGIFLQTNGDIKSVLRPLLLSPELLHGPPILKRPFDYTISALRAFNADTDGGIGVQKHLEAMGQPLFAWPMPDGYPEGTRPWTGALIPRWNYALALAGQTISNTTIDTKALAAAGRRQSLNPSDTLLEMAFGASASDPALANLRACASVYADPKEYAAVVLMAPAFQWR